MDRFDGTSARQLVLIDESERPIVRWDVDPSPRRSLRLLRKDIYTELARRRRRAQITARHLLEKK